MLLMSSGLKKNGMLATLTAATHRIMMMIIFASLLFISEGYCLASKILKCPTAQEIPSCEKLHTAKGFTYIAPLMNQLINECEHGWYYTNGTFIKDSTGGITPKNLTLTICEDVQLHIDCHSKPFICTIPFTVPKNSTTMEPQENNKDQEDKKDEGQALMIVFIVILIVVVVFIIFIIILKCCKRRNGCWQNGVV